MHGRIRVNRSSKLKPRLRNLGLPTQFCESCLRSIAIHEAAGVDELQFLMATETVPHERVMSSIELFGKHVIPELKKKRQL